MEEVDVQFSASEILLVQCQGLFLFLKNESTNTIIGDFLIGKGSQKLGKIKLLPGNYIAYLSLFGTGIIPSEPSAKASLEPQLGCGSATITVSALDNKPALPEYTLNLGERISNKFYYKEKELMGPDFSFTATELMSISTQVSGIFMNTADIKRFTFNIYKESIFGERVCSLMFSPTDFEIISPPVLIPPGKYVCMMNSGNIPIEDPIIPIIPLSTSINIGRILAVMTISISAGPPVGPKLEYSYDMSGNCTGRNVIILQSSAKVSSEQQEPAITFFEDKQVNVKIYPNPTQGYLKVEIPDFTGNEYIMMSLYDMSGKLYKNFKVKESNVELDMSGYSTGTYILRMNRNGKYSSWRIIKIN